MSMNMCYIIAMKYFQLFNDWFDYTDTVSCKILANSLTCKCLVCYLRIYTKCLFHNIVSYDTKKMFNMS